MNKISLSLTAISAGLLSCASFAATDSYQAPANTQNPYTNHAKKPNNDLQDSSSNQSLDYDLQGDYSQGEKAKSGFVLSANVGYAQANSDFKNANLKFKKGNLFYGATLGLDFALSHSITIGPEAGVFYGKSISKYEDNQGYKKVSNLIVPVLAKIQFTAQNGFNVFAKGGVSYVHPSVEKHQGDTKIHWDNSWNFTAAGGIGYQIDNVNLFVQYMHIFGKKSLTIDNNQGTGYASNIDAVTAGVSFVF